MDSLIIESLQNGSQRITYRVDGRSMEHADHVEITKEICLDFLNRHYFMHRTGVNTFDFTYIALNDKAKTIMH